MSDLLQYTLLTLLVVGSFVILLGLGAAANAWESWRARRQFSLLAQEYRGHIQETRRLFSPSLLTLRGSVGGHEFTVETREVNGGRVNIGGIPTPVQGLGTRLTVAGQEVWLGWYLTSNRRRQKIVAVLLDLCSPSVH